MADGQTVSIGRIVHVNIPEALRGSYGTGEVLPGMVTAVASPVPNQPQRVSVCVFGCKTGHTSMLLASVPEGDVGVVGSWYWPPKV